MMDNIRQLTGGYVAAFNARDLGKLEDYLAADFELTDPEVKALTPKTAVLNYIKRLFDANINLSFEAHQIIVDGDVSVIHFRLTLGETVLDGVDVITWKSGQMTKMHAYLTSREV